MEQDWSAVETGPIQAMSAGFATPRDSHGSRVITYMEKGQSDRASVRIISGRLAARTL